MQYLLTTEEYEKLINKASVSALNADTVGLQKNLITDLRSKIMEQAKFTCFHDLSDAEYCKKYVDEGYCDPCPLSFCSNEGKETKHKMCGHDSKLYSK